MQRVVRTAGRTVGCELPSLDQLYTDRTVARCAKIISDPSHPAHHLFQRLPSERQYRTIRACTSRFRDSFFPRAMKVV